MNRLRATCGFSQLARCPQVHARLLGVNLGAESSQYRHAVSPDSTLCPGERPEDGREPGAPSKIDKHEGSEGRSCRSTRRTVFFSDVQQLLDLGNDAPGFVLDLYGEHPLDLLLFLGIQGLLDFADLRF